MYANGGERKNEAMVLMKTCIALFTAGFLLVSCMQNTSQELMLLDFESDAALDQLDWHCHVLNSVSSDYATHGSKALKMELYPSAYPGLDVALTRNDWRDYEILSFDVYSPSSQAVRVIVRIDDRRDYAVSGDWYNESFRVNKGANHISIPFESFVVVGTGRKLNLAHIYSLLIFVEYPAKKTILYLDAVKLQRKMK